MVENASELKTIILKFSNELTKMGIHIERVLLYGSQAKGISVEGSDIDLIVISPDWAPYSNRERLEMLGIAAARILEPVQACGFTPQETSNHQLLPYWEHILNEQAILV